ncbi:GNAT family N-acetyltransferase [Aquipseudomonas alcaligenes]|uniref:GNAT family N-acetyltransferase n=1 Tax=Aquipseudomonas alcaligenes TaxID=43263 RepID=A0A2V4KF46_AQUAC|nr:GNAT family protein [Pseudomonas alcaligenes]PYC20225.1 GNAT family N-acetyltransferase [Pseudomonas alcaligenes]
MTLTVSRAGIDDIDAVCSLFSGYLAFYGVERDAGAVRDYLAARLGANESVIFLCSDGAGRNVGFAQLYPSFSSLGLQRIWILNDLFVEEAKRGLGGGLALVLAAQGFVVRNGQQRLVLETAVDNAAAQALYERCGFELSTGFHSYCWTAPRS